MKYMHQWISQLRLLSSFFAIVVVYSKNAMKLKYMILYTRCYSNIKYEHAHCKMETTGKNIFNRRV